MKFSINDIINITSANLIKGNDIKQKFSISTDTRSLSEDNLFLPLKGSSFDGHNFFEKSINSGCKGYFIEKNKLDKIFNSDDVDFIIEVEDTLIAYLKLAKAYKNIVNPKTIAITGSSGKTTTKELVYSVFSDKFKTHKSKLNYNNEIGLCQTLLSMPEDTEVLIIEMGMRGLGEIELLSKYSEPDIAIITNVGTAHIGRLGTIDKIADAKCEITKYMKDGALLIAYNDDLIKLRTKDIDNSIFFDTNDVFVKEHVENKIDFEYKNNNYSLNVAGEHNALNAICAIETALYLGMSHKEINEGLKDYGHLEKRGEIIFLKNNIMIINDCYNANPDAVKASINLALQAYSLFKVTIVIGDMEELGEYEEKLHKEIGLFINNKNIYELLTIGKKAEIIAKCIDNPEIKVNSFNNKKEIIEYIKENVEANTIILLKASRKMELETIVESLKEGD